VSIAPRMLNVAGMEDGLVEHMLDPGSLKDDQEFANLIQTTGPNKCGVVPQPEQFQLTFVNAIFGKGYNPPDSDDEETAGVEGQATTAVSDSAVRTCFGVQGITQTGMVRRRLRALRNSLAVALLRLANKGCMVFVWPGLPFHPMLLFLTASLRTLFQRVHLVIQSGTTRTFEVYVLCVKFDRDAIDNPVGGSPGATLHSFVNSACRGNGVDDVLMWTLTEKALKAESKFGGGSKLFANNYEDLWRDYANMIKVLSIELDAMAAVRASKAKLKVKPKPKRLRTGSLAKADAKAAEAAEERDLGETGGASDSDHNSEDIFLATLEKLPQVAKSGKTKEDLAKRDSTIPLIRTRRKEPLRPSRSLPFLATTLGAAPGCAINGPDPIKLGERWPLIKYGWKRAELSALL